MSVHKRNITFYVHKIVVGDLFLLYTSFYKILLREISRYTVIKFTEGNCMKYLHLEKYTFNVDASRECITQYIRRKRHFFYAAPNGVTQVIYLFIIHIFNRYVTL